MPAWDSDQYLRFVDERTQPARDLAARIQIPSPKNIIDLGCGPGNSTQVLAARWPAAQLTGLDNSQQMIESARASDPLRSWVREDISSWAQTNKAWYDVIFSSAALQWVDDHATLLPRLMSRLRPGGALAVQVPADIDAAPHRAMRELARSATWREAFPPGGVREWHVHDTPFYYDVLAPHAQRVQIWETEYVHVLPSAQAVVDWYQGTGLRPFLQCLTSDDQQEQFLAEYLEQIRRIYPPRQNGQLLFPFRRLFMIACQSD